MHRVRRKFNNASFQLLTVISREQGRTNKFKLTLFAIDVNFYVIAGKSLYFSWKSQSKMCYTFSRTLNND